MSKKMTPRDVLNPATEYVPGVFVKNTAISLLVIIITSVSTLSLSQLQQPVYAAPLTSSTVMPSNNIVSTTSTYEITFTTATAGTIQKIEIAFPAGYNVGSARLIETAGIRAGTISAPNAAFLVYTVTSPVNLPANIPIRLEVGRIINTDTASNASISITTKDTAGTIIDGPTIAPNTIKSIGSSDIGDGTISGVDIANDAITDDKIVDGSVGTNDLADNSVIGQKIVDYTISRQKILAGAIDTDRIQNQAVDTNKIKDFTINTPDVNRNYITWSIYKDCTGPEFGAPCTQATRDKYGWDPNGQATSFNIKAYHGSHSTTVVPIYINDPTLVFITLDFSGSAICAVADKNPDSLRNSFQVSCNRAPSNGATLSFMVVNGVVVFS